MADASCPVCKSPFASWEVRPLFTCYHCHWALSANVGDAFRLALVVGVATECLVLLSLRLWFGNLIDTLDVWLSLSTSCGVLVGAATYGHRLVITPLRPQHHLNT